MDLVFGWCMVAFEWEGFVLESFRNYTSLYISLFISPPSTSVAGDGPSPSLSLSQVSFFFSITDEFSSFYFKHCMLIPSIDFALNY